VKSPSVPSTPAECYGPPLNAFSIFIFPLGIRDFLFFFWGNGKRVKGLIFPKLTCIIKKVLDTPKSAYFSTFKIIPLPLKDITVLTASIIVIFPLRIGEFLIVVVGKRKGGQRELFSRNYLYIIKIDLDTQKFYYFSTLKIIPLSLN